MAKALVFWAAAGAFLLLPSMVCAQDQCSTTCGADMPVLDPPLECATIELGGLADCGCLLALAFDNTCEAPIEASGFIFEWCGPPGREIADCGEIAPGARGEEHIEVTENHEHRLERQVIVDGTVHTLSTTVHVRAESDEDDSGCSLRRSASNMDGFWLMVAVSGFVLFRRGFLCRHV